MKNMTSWDWRGENLISLYEKHDKLGLERGNFADNYMISIFFYDKFYFSILCREFDHGNRNMFYKIS